jgi:hypothetical protein
MGTELPSCGNLFSGVFPVCRFLLESGNDSIEICYQENAAITKRNKPRCIPIAIVEPQSYNMLAMLLPSTSAVQRLSIPMRLDSRAFNCYSPSKLDQRMLSSAILFAALERRRDVE